MTKAPQDSTRQWTRDPTFALWLAGELREHYAHVKARLESNGGVKNDGRVRLLQLQRAIFQLERTAGKRLRQSEELII